MDELRGVDAVGIPWYERADYPRIRFAMVDREKLPLTFDEWERNAKDMERSLTRRGHTIVRATLNAKDFVAWCSARGLRVDADARMHWANEAVMRQLKGEH